MKSLCRYQLGRLKGGSLRIGNMRHGCKIKSASMRVVNSEQRETLMMTFSFIAALSPILGFCFLTDPGGASAPGLVMNGVRSRRI